MCSKGVLKQPKIYLFFLDKSTPNNLMLLTVVEDDFCLFQVQVIPSEKIVFYRRVFRGIKKTIETPKRTLVLDMFLSCKIQYNNKNHQKSQGIKNDGTIFLHQLLNEWTTANNSFLGAKNRAMGDCATMGSNWSPRNESAKIVRQKFGNRGFLFFQTRKL